MKKVKEFSEAELKYIAGFIMKHYYEPYTRSKKTIFLCGKGLGSKRSKRMLVKKVILSGAGWKQYDVIFPEKMIGSLYKGHGSHDLFSIEKELADSVDYIVIVPESKGAENELATFVQDDSLRPKILCILFDHPKKRRTYFDYGPLKFLKSKTGNILNFDSKISEAKLKYDITCKLMELPIVDKGEVGLNAFLSENFLLPAVYLMEPLPPETALKLFGHVGYDDKAKLAVDISTKILIQRRQVTLTNGGIELSERGFNRFMNEEGGRGKKFYQLNELRVQILNRQFRNKKLKKMG